MRRWVIRIAVVLGILAAAFALRSTVLAPDAIEVQAEPVARGRVEETVTNSRAGTLKARRRAQISPEVGGRAVAIPHREGERVEKGDVLLRLDTDVLEARTSLARRELEAVRAQREQSCAAAERSRRELGRISRLAKEGIVSVDLLDQAQTSAETSAAACRAAQAGVQQAQASVDLSARQAGQMVIRAPFPGVIADVSIELGEYTTPSPPGMPIPPVIDLIDPESVYVSAPMDEVDSARISVGQPARITIDSHPGRSFPGRVRRIAPYVLDREEQNRTVEIEAELEPKPQEARMLPGTSADVEVILAARADALRVPTPALLEGNRVLVVENGKLAERRLEIGLKNWDWTEVRSGLSAGDLVVTSLDRPEIRAGVEVRVAPGTAK